MAGNPIKDMAQAIMLPLCMDRGSRNITGECLWRLRYYDQATWWFNH